MNEDKIYDNEILDFLASNESEKVLLCLNNLRNRIVHRGSFVLRYEALDSLVGAFLLPLVKQITELDEYKGLHEEWKYGAIYLGIDPIEKIISHFENESYDFDKMCYYKEISRAAYNNPLARKTRGLESFYKTINEKIIKRSEEIALYEVKSPDFSGIRRCPVCGLNSLVTYKEDDYDFDIVDGEQVISSGWWRNYEAICYCCSFEVNNTLKNPKECGLTINDFWICDYYK